MYWNTEFAFLLGTFSTENKFWADFVACNKHLGLLGGLEREGGYCEAGPIQFGDKTIT